MSRSSTITYNCGRYSRGDEYERGKSTLRRSRSQLLWLAYGPLPDRLAHHYFDIDLDILWATVTEELPALLAAAGEPEVPDR